MTAHVTAGSWLVEASITCKRKPKRYILSLGSRNCLVKERVRIVHTAGASRIAHGHSVELSKNVWKRKMARKRKGPHVPPACRDQRTAALPALCSDRPAQLLLQPPDPSTGQQREGSPAASDAVLAVPGTVTSRREEQG